MKKLVQIIGINGRFTHSALAIFYLREIVSKRCPMLRCNLLQFSINDNYFETLLRITNEKPQFMLFSAAIWNSSLIEKLIVDIHQLLPKSNIIIGGPQATVVGSHLPENICTIVHGEAEALPHDFFSALNAPNHEKKLHSHYFPSFWQMEKPWFDFPYCDKDFSTHLANRHVYYESSRGCPFRCSYCLSSAETGVYHKELEVVYRELRQILSHSPKVVRFIDRTFNDIPERSLAIWRFLQKQGGSTLFHFEMAPDRFTEEMFQFLETIPPGRFQFEIGIQSTNPAALSAVHRTMNMSNVTNNIKQLVALDTIHLHLDLILGLPYDTQEDFANSFRCLFDMGVHYIQMGLLKVLPHTKLANQAIDFGYISTKEPPYSLLASHWIDAATMQKLYWFSELVEKFMNNRYFTTLWHYLRRCKEDIYAFCNTIYQHCGTEFFFAPVSHEMLCRKIFEATRNRADANCIAELIALDWLRCNHRFLPDFLQTLYEHPAALRSTCQKILPEEIPGIYTRRQRNHFFRSSFFINPSKELLEEIDWQKSGRETIDTVVAFAVTTKQETSLRNYNSVVVVEENGNAYTLSS